MLNRLESRRVRGMSRYGDNRRGRVTYAVDPYMNNIDEERLSGYHERRINETGRRGGPRSDRNFRRERLNREDFWEHEDYYRGNEVDHGNSTRHHDHYISGPPGRNDRRWEEHDYMGNYDRDYRHRRDDRNRYRKPSRYHR